jgi:hypothetical protein
VIRVRSLRWRDRLIHVQSSMDREIGVQRERHLPGQSERHVPGQRERDVPGHRERHRQWDAHVHVSGQRERHRQLLAPSLPLSLFSAATGDMVVPNVFLMGS